MPVAKRSLPPGWRWVRLGEVADYINGRAFKPLEWVTAGLPIIRIQNLTSPESSFNYFDGQVEARYLVRNGDLLVSWSASLDAFIWNRGPAILNQHIFKVVEHDQIITKDYLYFALRDAMAEIRDQVHGATMRHITKPEFEAITIPLAPLPEQRRIAAILNEQMTAVERARAACEAQVAAARALPAAYLREVFESEEARRWQRKPLGEAGRIGSGITLGRQLGDLKTRRIAYLRVANVKDGHLDLSDVYQIEATEAEIERCTLQYGDILLTEGGDPDKLGRGTFWEAQIPECIHQNHIYRVRFDLEHFSPQFLSAQIGSPYGKAYFLAHAKQTTGIATINQKVLGQFPLMIPSRSTQDQVAARLSQKTMTAEQTLQALVTQLNAINHLPAALLRRAFDGEL